MKIGIIGAGNVGEALAKRCVEVGHEVKIANSRGPDTLRSVVQRTGAGAADLEGVMAEADVVIVAVPIDKITRLPKASFQALPSKTVVVDTANYQPLLFGNIPEIDNGMLESDWIARQLGRPVVKAFNAMTAHSMAHRARPMGASDRVAVPVAGNDPQARGVIKKLVEEIGFDPYDAGPIAESWRQQPGQPTYAADPNGKEIVKLLGKADKAKAPQKRDNAMKLMAKLPPDFPIPDLVQVARFFAGLDLFKPRSWGATLRLMRATKAKKA